MQEQDEHITQKEQSTPCAQEETLCSASAEGENVLQQQSKESETNVGHLLKQPVLRGNEEASSSKRACLDKSSPDEHEKDSFDDFMRKLDADVKRIVATLKDPKQADNGNKAILSEFLKQLKRGFTNKTADASSTSSGNISKYVEANRKIRSQKPTVTAAAPLLVNLEQQNDEIQPRVSNIQKQRASSTVGRTLRKRRRISDDSSTIKNNDSDGTTICTYPLRSRRNVVELSLTREQRNEDDPSNVKKQHDIVLHADKKTTPTTPDNNDGSCSDACNVTPVLELIPVSNSIKRPRTPFTWTEPLCQPVACFCEVSTTEDNDNLCVTTALPLTSQPQSGDDQVNVCNIQTDVTTTLPSTSQPQSGDDEVNVCNIQTDATTALPLTCQQREQQSDQVNVSSVQKPPTMSTGTETSREIVASSCNFSTAEEGNDPKRNVPTQGYDNNQASRTDRETSTKGHPDDPSTLENFYNNKIRKYQRYGSHTDKAPVRRPEKTLGNNQPSVSNVQPLGETSTCSGVSSTVRSNSPDGTSTEKEKERRAAEKALSEQQKMEYAKLLPATFRQLQDIMRERSGRPFQNFLAVVSDITPPRKSRGRDHYSKIYIVDPCFSEGSLELMWFDQPEYFPNIYRPGEIVIWHDVKCQTHRYDLQLIKNTRTKVTVIPWNDDPKIMKMARFPPVTFPEHFRKSVNFLNNWRQQNKGLFNAIPFVDFSKEIDVGVYVNLCVRLCKLAVQENKTVFTVCDGNIPRFSGHDRREDTSKVASTGTCFDVTSEFRATELIDIEVKGEFGMKDNISKYRLKARDVIAFYGVFVKKSKRGNIKLVLTNTDIEPQGFIKVKREYVQNPYKQGDPKFHFKKW